MKFVSTNILFTASLIYRLKYASSLLTPPCNYGGLSQFSQLENHPYRRSSSTSSSPSRNTNSLPITNDERFRTFVPGRKAGSTRLPSNFVRCGVVVMPMSLPTINFASVVSRSGAVVVSVLVLAWYHIQLWRVEQRDGMESTWRSSQASTREQWAKFVRETEQWLYAIQTLRNAITANTFLATTVLSLLTVISGKLWEMIRNVDPQVTTTIFALSQRRVLTIQFASIALFMLMSAYEFLQSARLMTHAGFMFPVSPKKTKVDVIMRKSQSSQWLGLRFLYISLAFILWTVGGENLFLLSSIALVQFFRKIDRVPKGLNEEDNEQKKTQ